MCAKYTVLSRYRGAYLWGHLNAQQRGNPPNKGKQVFTSDGGLGPVLRKCLSADMFIWKQCLMLPVNHLKSFDAWGYL